MVIVDIKVVVVEVKLAVVEVKAQVIQVEQEIKTQEMLEMITEQTILQEVL